MYHRNCFALFVTSRKPFLEETGQTYLSAGRKGQLTDDHMYHNFDALCCWLEDNFDELCSVDDLHMKMIVIVGSVDTVYSRKHLKRKLIEHYGDNVFLSDVNGKHNVVCFRNAPSVILTDRWYHDRCCNPQ